MSTAKIFVRERRKSREKGRMPRYRMLAVVGVDLQISAEHFRKKELEEIASAVQAELVYLKDAQDESGDCSND